MSDFRTEKNDVLELVRKAESDYQTGTTTISKHVSVNMKDTLDRIDAYLNSKHISGETDSMDREKPFFNIVTAAVNIWYRATDLDRKNIRIKATKRIQDIPAFLATIHLQNWMRGSKNTKQNFGQFLNAWGRSLAKYGSSVVKFVETNGELHHSVIPWSRLIVDPIDFDNNPVIEKLQFTPAQLRKNKNYDQDMVERLIEANLAVRTDRDGNKKDNKSNYIELYEVHGEMELSKLTGKEADDDVYEQQMHVVSYVVRSEKMDEFDDFTLFKGKESQSPYMITHLIEEDDQTLSIGAVQNLFESQWMVNHSVKSMKDQLDVASKLIFQTSDGNYVGQNTLEAIEQGDILVHQPGQPLTQVANNAHDVSSQQNFLGMWQQLGNQINGLSEAMLGKNAPAGSAWRQTEALLQESYSLFEVMTENKGFYAEQMLRRFVIPFLRKKMDTSDEIGTTLESYQLDKLDSMFLPNEAIRRYNARATEKVLNGELPDEYNPQTEEAQLKGELNQLGNNRFFKPSDIPTKTWKELFKDLEWEAEIDITSEQKDMQVVMDTLNTALKMFVSATPQQLQDPNFKLVFNKILEQTNVISPIEIASMPPTPPPQPQAPPEKISQSVSFKDLPPDGQVQLAEKAGIKINPPQPAVVVQPNGEQT